MRFSIVTTMCLFGFGSVGLGQDNKVMSQVDGVRFELSASRGGESIGNAVYENNGSRFVYRFFKMGDPMVDAIAGGTLAFGFDGNEFWLTVTKPPRPSFEMKTNGASVLLRGVSLDAFSSEMPDEVTHLLVLPNYPNDGMDELIRKFAVIENVKSIFGLGQRDLSKAPIQKAARAVDSAQEVSTANLTDVRKRWPWVDVNKDRSFLTVSSGVSEKLSYDYLIELDDLTPISIRNVSVLANNAGGVWIRDSRPPYWPFPPTFEVSRTKTEVVNVLEFLPQQYSNSGTTILTLTCGGKLGKPYDVLRNR